MRFLLVLLGIWILTLASYHMGATDSGILSLAVLFQAIGAGMIGWGASR